MNKEKLLQDFQSHGDLAFQQGYEAALRGIPKDDRVSLAQMHEGHKRLSAFQKLFHNVLEIPDSN